MGVTNVKATIGNPADNSRTCEVEFLVDSGATYSLVPSEILSELEKYIYFTPKTKAGLKKRLSHP